MPVEREPLRVAYAGPVAMASNTANTLRVVNVCQALVAAGLPPVVVGSGDPLGTHGERGDGAAVFTGLGELPSPQAPRPFRVARGLTWGAATRDWLRGLQPRPDVLLLYGAQLGYLARLLPEARRLGIAVVPDVVEWHDPSALPGGRLGPFSAANALAMRRLAPRATHLLVMSRYLERFFTGRGAKVLRVPPLFPVATDASAPHRPGGRLALAYVGHPARKDRATLLSLLRLPTTVPGAAGQLTVHIAGPDAAIARALLGDSGQRVDWNSSALVWHGSVDNNTARGLVAGADFVVLQRPPARFAMAGYPSKVAEALSLGTPVLANPTSDLGEDLEHGRTAWMLANESAEALGTAVEALLAQPAPFDRAEVLQAAAARYSPEAYADRLREFLTAAAHTARQGAP